jgi:hypothetical protein
MVAELEIEAMPELISWKGVSDRNDVRQQQPDSEKRFAWRSDRPAQEIAT